MAREKDRGEIPKGETYLKDTAEKFLEHRLAGAGLILIIIEIFFVVFVPLVFKLDPYTSDAMGFGAKPPGGVHLLGTDVLGRDIFSRLVYGGRTSLVVGISSSLIGLILGAPLGLFAAYYRGWMETTVMRLADIFMSFPAMILILVLVAVVGTSIWSVTIVIGILGWPQYARLIHARVLSVREMEYVESARAVGTRNLGIILKYILPNSIAPILIQFTFRTAQAIIMESSLSFLGMGIQPPISSWGNMMYDAQAISILANKPFVWVPPGLALVLTVLSINSVGDGIRDAMDPKTRI
ncbi:MAG: ABC transporter permease [Treponema sp.]|nr:ABC transporter permease [Treponema sp.]